MCPICGSERLEWECNSYTETHGLDCGPYEHWTEEGYRCLDCKGFFEPGELDEPEEVEQTEVEPMEVCE
jgi:hypothetical protein